jgi:toluene monooxygenase system protein E
VDAPEGDVKRTYWHLEEQRRRPSPYDIATSRLLYYPGRGFEVPGSADAWMRRHQTGSPLTCSDWGAFRDPRETTYTRYVERQREREAFVDGVLRAAEHGDHDRRLPAAWVAALGRVLAPLRFPAHGLQMAGAYVAQMAPEGRIVAAGLFQVGDEIRRIQRLSYRLRQLQLADATTGDGRATWEQAPAWQPLRRLVERMLVTYDWGEAFVALCLVVKPTFDGLVAALGRAGQGAGDHLLHDLLFSLGEDAVWHREWAVALARVAIADRSENRTLIAGWVARWRPGADDAAAALAPELGGADLVAAQLAAVRQPMWAELAVEET